LDFNAFVSSLNTLGINLSDRERSAAWAQASSESAKPTMSRVEVLDQSLGGYRIYWANAANLRAKVGEVIVMSTPVEEGDDDPRDWMIGVLRWLRGGNNESLEAGVQLLTRQAEAIAVRATPEQRNKVLHRGLILTPLNHLSDANPMLLTNTLVEATHSTELLRLPDEFSFEPRLPVNPISNLTQLENSGSYKLFSYSMATQTGSNTEHRLPGAELEAIWSTV
jgi:cyclic-di-GMP-binding protein